MRPVSHHPKCAHCRKAPGTRYVDIGGYSDWVCKRCAEAHRRLDNRQSGTLHEREKEIIHAR